MSDSRIVRVSRGRVEPFGSWVYVWIDVADGSVVYIGATPYEPELRAHLHLASDDPALARARSHVPDIDRRDFDVHAFPVPQGVARAAVKEAMIALLAASAPAPSHDGLAALVRRAIERAMEQE